MAQTNFSECIRNIRSVSYALNKLEVRGRENLDILLGSIQALDKSAVELERGLQELSASSLPSEALNDVGSEENNQ